MERIDAERARDHIEMVERILAESQQRLCAGGEYFAVWGTASASITLVAQLAGHGVIPQIAWLWLPIVLLAASTFSVVRARSMRHRTARTSLLQREFFNVLWITIALAFLVDAAAFRIFSGMASAAIWNVVSAIVLFYIGLHGNRRAQIAGILVLGSLIAANFVPSAIVGYVLAAGMLFGYAGFGVAELLARD